MKKLQNLMMVALMGCMCMTSFTACGGDDDDDIPGQDVPGTVTYFEPCFDWGSNTDHVKAYMSGSWQLVDGSNDYALLYTNSQNTTTVTYSFLGSNRGLNMVAVNYITSKAQSIISEIERRYKTTLTMDADSSKKGDTVYVGQATIGGRTIAIAAHCTSASVSVFFRIPD